MDDNLLQSEYVFIDTSVYQKNNFNFSTHEMSSLQNFLDEDVILIVPTVTIREVEKHILDKLKESQSALQSFKAKAMILRNSDKYADSSLFEKIDVESMSIELINKFHEFISENGCQTLPMSGSVVEEVFDSYFASRPPFSKEKTKEFSDAFVLETLLEKSKALGKPIYIVSLDTDMKNFCAAHPELIFADGLGEYLDIVSRTVLDAPSRKAAAALDAALAGLFTQVSDWLDTVKFEVDDGSSRSRSEVNTCVIKNIVSKNELVYLVEDDVAAAGVDYEFEVWTTETIVNDYIPPDPELTTSNVVERVNVQRKYKKTLELGLTLDFSAEDPADASIEDIDPGFPEGETLTNPFETVVVDRAIIPRPV